MAQVMHKVLPTYFCRWLAYLQVCMFVVHPECFPAVPFLAALGLRYLTVQTL